MGGRLALGLHPLPIYVYIRFPSSRLGVSEIRFPGGSMLGQCVYPSEAEGPRRRRAAGGGGPQHVSQDERGRHEAQ